MTEQNKTSKIFLVACGLAFFSIALQALYDPQLVMNLVQDELTNINSRNSIRALYGGVNLAFGIFMIYSAFSTPDPALILLVLYTGGFFLGRILGFLMDGTGVSSFIKTWTVVELLLCLTSLALLRSTRKKKVFTKETASL